MWMESSVAVANVTNWTSRSPVTVALLRTLRSKLDNFGASVSARRLLLLLILWSDLLSLHRDATDMRDNGRIPIYRGSLRSPYLTETGSAGVTNFLQ